MQRKRMSKRALEQYRALIAVGKPVRVDITWHIDDMPTVWRRDGVVAAVRQATADDADVAGETTGVLAIEITYTPLHHYHDIPEATLPDHPTITLYLDPYVGELTPESYGLLYRAGAMVVQIVRHEEAL